MTCGITPTRWYVRWCERTRLSAPPKPEDVAAYCEKLINMGMKGGFMLSSGCEVPMNAKPENVKAMLDAVKMK